MDEYSISDSDDQEKKKEIDTSDDRSYPVIFVLGLVIGAPIGQALIGGSAGLTIGLVVGGGIGKALQSLVSSRMKQTGRDEGTMKKQFPSLAIASVVSGLVSLTMVALVILGMMSGNFDLVILLVLGIVSGIFGISLGFLQFVRRTSSRVLASGGIVLSLISTGLASLIVSAIVSGLPLQSTPYEEILERVMGYDRSLIDNPLDIELFRAVDQPTAQWRYSGAVAPLGWYRGGGEEEIPIEIPLVGIEPTTPVSFDPGDSTFGFFMRVEGVYEWYTESGRNADGESHIKVYPTIADGREVPNSYVICWEDYPLDAGPSGFIDFTDLIVRVDGIEPVTAEENFIAP